MKYKNVVLLGTSHIARQSLEEVSNAFEIEKPDIVAIELDKKRLPGLMSKAPKNVDFRNIRRIGLKGFLFSWLGAWVERKLGKLVGVVPGSEMKTAIILAKKNRIQIALIDQDIEITLKRLSKELTWKERWNFIKDLFKGLVLRKQEIKFDLTKVPSKKIIRQMIDKVKIDYPNVYKTLIEERNHVMAKNLRNIMDLNQSKKILAVMGAGHIDDVMDLIKKHNEPEINYSFSVG